MHSPRSSARCEQCSSTTPPQQWEPLPTLIPSTRCASVAREKALVITSHCLATLADAILLMLLKSQANPTIPSPANRPMLHVRSTHTHTLSLFPPPPSQTHQRSRCERTLCHATPNRDLALHSAEIAQLPAGGLVSDRTRQLELKASGLKCAREYQ